MPLDGTTMMVATTGVEPVFIAVKAGMLPLPLAASPIVVLLFVQLKEVPLNVPVNATAFVVAPLHNTWSAGCTTFGEGFTVMVNISGVPVQVRCTGVTVMVAVTGVLPVLVA